MSKGRWQPLAVLTLAALLAACSPAADDGAADTLSDQTTVGAPATTTIAAAPTTAPATTTPSTVPPASVSSGDGDLDCLDFWSDDFVSSVAPGYTFTEMSADGTICTFLSGSNSIGVSFRDGDQGLYEASKAGAALTADSVQDLSTDCDASWFTDITITIAEGISGNRGRIFNATMIGPDDPESVAAELLSVACSGPQFSG